MPQRPNGRPRRPPPGAPPPIARPERRAAVRPTAADDRFFRHIVNSMRNGVIAFRRDGTLALMNDEAYRTFSLVPSAGNLGRPFADVLRERPDVIRVMAGAVGVRHPPQPAELPLKDSHRLVAYPPAP